jgi:hypothetical protein
MPLPQGFVDDVLDVVVTVSVVLVVEASVVVVVLAPGQTQPA